MFRGSLGTVWGHRARCATDHSLLAGQRVPLYTKGQPAAWELLDDVPLRKSAFSAALVSPPVRGCVSRPWRPLRGSHWLALPRRGVFQPGVGKVPTRLGCAHGLSSPRPPELPCPGLSASRTWGALPRAGCRNVRAPRFQADWEVKSPSAVPLVQGAALCPHGH